VSEPLHYEDFYVGQVMVLGPKLVTKDDIVAFAREFDPQPFHLDEKAGRASILGGLAASGWHTCSLLVRLICDACLSQSTVLGSRGMEEVKWLGPVLAGDILSGEIGILSARRSQSRPGVGILTFTSFLADQHGTRKIEMSGMFFVRARSR
jgi:acyl dehydratase